MNAQGRPGQLLRNLVRFGQLLRGLGLTVTSAELRTLVAALQVVGLTARRDVKDAARAVLVQRHEHIALFDLAFDRFWNAAIVRRQPDLELGRQLRRATRSKRKVVAVEPADPETASSPAAENLDPLLETRFTFSDREVLRRKDFAALSEQEAQAVRRLLRQQVLVLPPRRTRRTAPHRAGDRLDLRRTLRAGLRHGGEPLTLAWRKRRQKRRPLVVLADISGSMEPYARLLLQFVYTLGSATDRLEAFVFATRLTRISRQLRHRNVDHALRQVTDAVRDWSGGTRIGAALHRFNYQWSRRVLGQGAVVLVISDGWDRGDVELLEREVAHLSRSCERLMWLNPLLGSAGYQPLTRGIRAILPHIDDFMPVHNLLSLEQLARHLATLGLQTRR